MGLQVMEGSVSLLHKLHCVFMEQLLLFVTVTHTGTGITRPEGSISVIYGQSTGAQVLIERLYSLLYCKPRLISLGNLSARWEQKANFSNHMTSKKICGCNNHVSLLCCLVFLKCLISSPVDHWVTNKNLFPGWLDHGFPRQ